MALTGLLHCRWAAPPFAGSVSGATAGFGGPPAEDPRAEMMPSS